MQYVDIVLVNIHQFDVKVELINKTQRVYCALGTMVCINDVTVMR